MTAKLSDRPKKVPPFNTVRIGQSEHKYSNSFKSPQAKGGCLHQALARAISRIRNVCT